MGTRFGSHYSQFPSLQPRSSVSCQAQISHSAAYSISQSLAQRPGQVEHMIPSCLLVSLGMHCQTNRMHGSPLLPSLGTQCQTGGAHGSLPPFTLGVSSWNIARGMPTIAGVFLTKQLPAAFNQAHDFSHNLIFQPVQKLSKSGSDMVQLIPSPGVTWHPSFSGASVHSPSRCLLPLCVSHFISIPPRDFQHPGSS